MSPIEHLQSVAQENHARFISGSEERAVFGVRPPNASGAPSPEFILEIVRERMTVSVRELKAVLLPSFCSERQGSDLRAILCHSKDTAFEHD
ncbi:MULTISPECIES: hypothetical protein [unclassified Ochrobactrum]|uniref:hypothetical protein n=1 Tax=unclassified Ochrobactrum TaxID=239106 RepID=UPI000DEF0E0F|nr:MULTISPECIES: hypothetical protein [unclassified Ochrobactrum]MBQ0709911.1 hypothetical protein [Ochrobactrum sp. AP1BH01-1]